MTSRLRILNTERNFLVLRIAKTAGGTTVKENEERLWQQAMDGKSFVQTNKLHFDTYHVQI